MKIRYLKKKFKKPEFSNYTEDSMLRIFAANDFWSEFNKLIVYSKIYEGMPIEVKF